MQHHCNGLKFFKVILGSAGLFILLMQPLSAQKRWHYQSILVDTHNDVLSSVSMKGKNINDNLKGQHHSDIQRFKKGGVDVQFFSIFCDERFGKDTAFQYANIEIDSLYAIVQRNTDHMLLATSTADIRSAVQKNKMAAMIGVEGGHMIEDKLENLDSLYKRGARYLTLTWNNSTSWASSAWDETLKKNTLPHIGLTPFGKQVIQRMNQLGMMIDLSHVGEQTFYDALQTTTKPVLVSHSNCYSICPVPRNLKDDQIKAIRKNGGVICINFYSGFLDSTYQKKLSLFLEAHKNEVAEMTAKGLPSYTINETLSEKYPLEAATLRPPLSLLIQHIDHIVALAGIDHVGLGSDFDGIESAPQSLNGVEDFIHITAALKQRGYHKNAIKKILGGNVLRVFAANQSVQ